MTHHCSSLRFSTSAPLRQDRPCSSTCSLARTVRSTGSQLTQPGALTFSYCMNETHQHAANLRNEALLMQQQKDLLGPPVVRRLARANLSAPVEIKAQTHHLPFHVLYVAACPVVRRDAALHGGIFRGKAKGVPADGVNDVEATHAVKLGQAGGNVTHLGFLVTGLQGTCR